MASIQRRPDGRWRARYRDESGREHSAHRRRKIDAQRWLDEKTADIVTGNYIDPAAARTTFAQHYSRWAPRQIWVPGTRAAMDLAAGSVTFADIPLGRLRQSHVEQWVKGMQGRGLAPGTIKTRVVNVRSVLRAAVRDRLLAYDPAEQVALPRLRRADAAMHMPAAEDVGALINASDPRFRSFIALGAFAALRLGEVCGLQVSDVDFLRRTVRVSRQIQRVKGSFEVRAPKYGSERTVFLPDALLAMIASHVAAYRPGDDPRRWMFEGEPGRPLHQNTAAYWWRRAKQTAGVQDVRFHDLRHFAASGMIAAGCDVVTVQRALGHARATTTLTVYAHLWPTAEDRTRQAVTSMMESALQIPADSLRTNKSY